MQLLRVNVLTEEVAIAWKFHGNANFPGTNFPSYVWTESLQMKDFDQTDLTNLWLQTLD